MSKRPSVSDFYGQKKKFKSPAVETKPHSGTLWADDEISLNVSDLPSDTESAFLYLRSRFLEKCRECHLPIVVLVHQLYSIVKCRTTVDKDLRVLQAKGIIRLFKLGGEESVLVVIKTDDLHDLVKERCPSKPVLDRFLKVVLPATLDVCIDKSTLTGKFCLTENDISDLMSGGLLTLRSVSSFWFSFPSSGEFVRTYFRGRKNVLRTIRKSKYSEILQQY
ncbi:inactive serine/threonine-protein kinase 19 isoform X2 [Anabrus simplex]|uniref:inactive serine/threonine-protein kinase 19 isoform X2 n=1 Tax=Anabrus simplex TaxID=316456 RepID=UPI0035A32A9E